MNSFTASRETLKNMLRIVAGQDVEAYVRLGDDQGPISVPLAEYRAAVVALVLQGEIDHAQAQELETLVQRLMDDAASRPRKGVDARVDGTRKGVAR